MERRRASRLLAATLLALLGLTGTVSAQAGNRGRHDDWSRAENSGRLERGGGYRTGNRHLPGTRDPFDHSAWLEAGFFHDRTTVGGAKTRLAYVPMRLGVDTPLTDHVQLRIRAGMAGLVDSLSGAGALDYRHRTFRPGNLEVGAYYALGGGDRGDLFRWTVYGGGTVLLPTAQLPKNESAAQAIRTGTSYLGGYAVHGLEGAWLFAPERWGFVPGVTGRAVIGPIFVNASVDVAFTIATDDTKPVHFASIRAEAGYRVDDTFRVGLGLTDVVGFGPGAGSGDNSQAAFRLFLRSDFAAFTFGEELVINRGAPFGNAFDGSGYWGLISTLGISL